MANKTTANVLELYRNNLPYGSNLPSSDKGTTTVAGTPYELFGAYTGPKYKNNPASVPTHAPTVASSASTVSNSGGVSSSGGAGNSSANRSVSYSTGGNYADQLKALYDQQQQKLNEYQQAQNTAAQNAYSKNLAALQSAYNGKMANLDNSLQNAKSQLASSYNASKKSINDDAAKAMQEAYVNRMMSQKNLQQQLSAQGLSGGASESAIAGLINNYGNARNNIDTTRNHNLSSLEQTYTQNLADLMQNYYNAKSAADENRLNYQMQLENTLANNATASYGNLYNAMSNLDAGYLSAMQDALANQASYQAQANTASNTVNNVTTENKPLEVGENVINFLRNSAKVGNTVENMIYDLEDRGYNANQIAEILTRAGVS